MWSSSNLKPGARRKILPCLGLVVRLTTLTSSHTAGSLLSKRVPTDGCVHVPPSISATAPDISRVCSWAFRLGPTATADDQGARRDSRGAVASAWGKQMDMFNTSEMNYAAGLKPGNPLSQDGLCVNLRGWNKSLVWCLGFHALQSITIPMEIPWKSFPKNCWKIQNIFVCVPQKKEDHTVLEWHENE